MANRVFTTTGLHVDGELRVEDHYIDGDEGVLLYRGYPIDQLAEHGDSSRPAILLYGELPTTAQKADFDYRVTRHDGARPDCASSRAFGATPSDGGDGRLRRRARAFYHDSTDIPIRRSAWSLDADDRENADARRMAINTIRPAFVYPMNCSIMRRTFCACALPFLRGLQIIR